MEAVVPSSANKRRMEAEEPTTSSCTNTPPNIKSRNIDAHKEQLKFQDAVNKASRDCDWGYVFKRPLEGVGQTVVEHTGPPAAVTQTLWEYYSCDTRKPDLTFINVKPPPTHYMPRDPDVNLDQLIRDSLNDDSLNDDSLNEKSPVADGALRGRWRAFLKSQHDPLQYGFNRFDAHTLKKIKNFVATACNSYFCVGTRGQDLVLDIAMMECSRYFFGGVFLTAFVEWWVNWEKGDFEMAIPDFNEQASPVGVRHSVLKKRTYAVVYVLRYLKRVHAAFEQVQKLRDSVLEAQLLNKDDTITNERLVRFSERLTDFLTISLVDSYKVNYAAYNVYTLLVSTMAGFGTAVYDMMMPTISLLTTGGEYRYLLAPYNVCALNYCNNTTTDRERRDAVRLNPAAKTVMREMSRSNEVNFAWGLMEALRWMFERDLFVEYFATQVFIMEPLMYQEWEDLRTSLLETVRMEDRWRELLTCSQAAMDRLVDFRTKGNHNNAHSYLFALLMIKNEKSSTKLKERPDELVFKVVQHLLQLVWGPNSSRSPLDLLVNMIHTLEDFTSANTAIACYWVDCFWMLTRYVDVEVARERILGTVLFQSGAMGAVKLWLYQLLLGVWVYHLRMAVESGRNLQNDQGKLTRITIILNMARMLRNRSLTVLRSDQFEYDPDPQQDDLNDRIAAVHVACLWSEMYGHSDYHEPDQTAPNKTMFDFRDEMLLQINPKPKTTDPKVTLHQAIVDRMRRLGRLGPCQNQMFQFINKTDLMEPVSLDELEKSRVELNRRWDVACKAQADGGCPESVPRKYHEKWVAKNRGAAICPDNRIGEPITTYERGWNKVMPGMSNVTAYLDWEDVGQDPSGSRCDDAGNPLYPPVWRMCYVMDNKMYMSAPQRKRRRADAADAADAATVGRPVSFPHFFEADWVDVEDWVDVDEVDKEWELEQEGESVDGEDVSRRGAAFVVNNMRYTWMRNPFKQSTETYIRRCWMEWSSPPVLLSSEGLPKPHLDTNMVDDSCYLPYSIIPDDPQPGPIVKSSDLCMKTTWTYTNTPSVRATIAKSSGSSWTYNTTVPYVMSDWHSRRVPTLSQHDHEAFHPISKAVLENMRAMMTM